MKIEIKRIGIIHSPCKKPEDIPCNFKPEFAEGEIEIFKEYEDGLKDIEGFSHLKVLCYFHKSKRYSLHVKPFFDNIKRGVFSTDHPDRPNHIALTVVELLKREGNILKVRGVDMLDETPVIDIKPYTSIDRIENIRTGWLAKYMQKSQK